MKSREQQKAYNAENYPASVLRWLNEATDRAYDDIKERTCDNCKHKPKANENYLDPCDECSRFYGDYFEPKLN